MAHTLRSADASPAAFSVGTALALLPRVPRAPLADVVVVSDKVETREPLVAYLREAGVSVAGARTVETARRATTLVVFPDELDADDVTRALRRTCSARPDVLVLIVSSEPRRWAGAGLPVTTLAKPIFGWALLDAIRARGKEEA